MQLIALKINNCNFEKKIAITSKLQIVYLYLELRLFNLKNEIVYVK